MFSISSLKCAHFRCDKEKCPHHFGHQLDHVDIKNDQKIKRINEIKLVNCVNHMFYRNIESANLIPNSVQSNRIIDRRTMVYGIK